MTVLVYGSEGFCREAVEHLRRSMQRHPDEKVDANVVAVGADQKVTPFGDGLESFKADSTGHRWLQSAGEVAWLVNALTSSHESIGQVAKDRRLALIAADAPNAARLADELRPYMAVIGPNAAAEQVFTNPLHLADLAKSTSLSVAHPALWPLLYDNATDALEYIQKSVKAKMHFSLAVQREIDGVLRSEVVGNCTRTSAIANLLRWQQDGQNSLKGVGIGPVGSEWFFSAAVLTAENDLVVVGGGKSAEVEEVELSAAYTKLFTYLNKSGIQPSVLGATFVLFRGELMLAQVNSGITTQQAVAVFPQISTDLGKLGFELSVPREGQPVRLPEIHDNDLKRIRQVRLEKQARKGEEPEKDFERSLSDRPTKPKANPSLV